MEQRKTNIVFLVVLVGAVLGTWGLTSLYLTSPQTGTGNLITIQIDGSTTCLPIISACAEDFMDLYSNYDIQVAGGGSGDGIAHVTDGLVDIGMASRNVKAPPDENATGNLVDWKFCLDGIAIIVSSADAHGLSTADLTFAEIRSIWNGTYQDWSDVPGCSGSGDIVVWSRASGSGTLATFEELTGLEDDPEYPTNYTSHNKATSNGQMRTEISNNDDAIGYVGLGYLDSSVAGAVVESVSPTPSEVKAGNYPISRYLHLITNGAPNAGVQAFIDFVYGPTGQAIVEEEGFVTLY